MAVGEDEGETKARAKAEVKVGRMLDEMGQCV